LIEVVFLRGGWVRKKGFEGDENRGGQVNRETKFCENKRQANRGDIDSCEED
jgi:hypothetical protein